MNIFKSRKFRQGSAATVITVLGLALLLVFNMVVTLLGDRFSLNLDLTENSIFSLSDETKDFLRDLDKDVNIYVLNSEDNFTANGTYFVQASEVIKQYAQYSSHVKVQYINIVQDPTFVNRYPDLTLSSNQIVVDAGGNNQSVLTAYDLFNVQSSYYGSSITSSKAEQAMTSALLNVTSDKKFRVVVLTGHNEGDVSPLTSLLEMNNYEVSEQNLLTEEIDEEATIAIIASPQRDFGDDELKRLDRFLENGERYGKTLLYLASYEQPDLPALNAFLADWGINVGDGVVFESNTASIMNLNPYMPLAEYAEGEYAANVAGKQLRMLMPFARPLDVAFEAKSYKETTLLLQFSGTSGIRPADADSDWTMTQDDITGPIPAMILGTLTKYDQLTPMQSHVLASGSYDFIESSILGSPNVANSEYMLDVLNTLAGREDVIRIQDKTIGGSELGIDSRTAIILTVLLVIVFPLAVLVCGIVIWMMRRHR